MKKLYILLLFAVCAGYAQQPFITTWEITEADLAIRIPVFGTNNNYSVDFGDGTVLTNQSGPVTHQYTTAGIYTVSLSGDLNRVYCVGNDAHKLKSIEQWGDIVWTSMESAFSGCTMLTINATDLPNLSEVTNMRSMFFDCVAFNSNISNWDVSNVTNMSYMFTNATSFNQPLNDWDVSNVTNTRFMFSNSKHFNQPLNNWDVSNVTNMSYMFSYSEHFNQPLNDWDASNVTNMEHMFGDSVFNQPINNWDVSNVTNMNHMFINNLIFNQPLNDWDVSNVTDMSYMFESSTFNQPINNWDVSHVTDMSHMFESSTFNQSLNDWNVSNVTDMNYMFAFSHFNQPINNWDVSNVTDMSQMFLDADDFNLPLDNWDVSNVTTMYQMFSHTETFNQPINNWNVSNVGNMSGMFSTCVTFNQPLSNWDVSNVTTMTDLFLNCSAFNQDLSDWEFNHQVFLGGSLISGCNLDTDNYDALLARFAELQLTNRNLIVNNLTYCNIGIHNYLIDNLGWAIYEDSVGEDCPSNTLAGTMLTDENQNGCDADDTPAVNFMVKATNGTHNYGTFVNNTGAYNLRLQEGIFTVNPVNIPDYFTVTSPSSEVTFTGFGNTEALNFCLVPNQSIQDLKITILPVSDARPGFDSTYKILVENMGTQTTAGATVTMNFDNTLQNFVSATPAPAATTANQLTFALGNVGVFETKAIDLTMQTFMPPIVNGWETAHFTATVAPGANDNTPDDNTFALNQTIVNSFDPNDKRVVQGDEIFMEQADEYLDYIIRFQNTGTASAITVKVNDILGDKLDWNTLKPISASHAYRVEITEGNKVSFIFDNINLPHEAADASGSNGYIAYKIKPLSTIQLGDVISGDSAGIYFDFNLPIITNTVATTVVEPLGVKENIKSSITLYPNPASTLLHIQPKVGTQVQQVKIYNLQGRELMAVSGRTESIDVSQLSAGMYMLEVKTGTGSANYKLVKK